MLFVIRFTDDPERREVREKNRDAHLAWLAERKNTILVAGSLRADLGANATGAIWIVEAGSKAEVENLYTTDPFWVKGLRKGVEIFHWTKAFPDQQALV